MKITLDEIEISALYAFLKGREGDLDTQLLPILSRMEQILYQQLSIDELERLTSSLDIEK
ncbi:MAG: hypothetical protein CMN78_06395 [Spirochaetales bacterium]|nr:hypothetical protein [Spirochaetales bacterium]